MVKRDLVVIGASAGGIDALQAITAQLPADLAACVLAVIHVGPSNDLSRILGQHSRLSTSTGENGEPLQKGHLYVAPPDHHMLVDGDHIRLTHGPLENRARPAIDPLFRSAAVSRGPRVIGTVLSGYLDDGSAGLRAIKQCGGLALIQDPSDAACPEMPRSALRAVKPDHLLPIASMGPVIARLAGQDVAEEFSVDPSLAGEVIMNPESPAEVGKLARWGNLAGLGCPECGGPIWERREQDQCRYRCLIGHAFSARNLLAAQSETIDMSLWIAVRAFEEHARTLATLAEDEQHSGSEWMKWAECAASAREKAQTLRSLLQTSEIAAQSSECA